MNEQSTQEPVAWMYECNGERHLTFTDQSKVEKENPHFPKSVPLYTHPAPAVAQEPVLKATGIHTEQDGKLYQFCEVLSALMPNPGTQLYTEAPAVAQSWELNEETAKFLADLILANDEPTPVTLSVGFIKDDEGKIQHGLRVHESEYPEEGAELLVESTPSPQKAPPADVVRELVETLQWYQEQARLCRLIHSEGDEGRNALANDGGNRAKAALKSAKEHGL